MGDGNQIIPAAGKPARFASTEPAKPDKPQNFAEAESATRKNPKENAALLLDREWEKSKADKLKNNLEKLISGNDKKNETEPQKTSKNASDERRNSTDERKSSTGEPTDKLKNAGFDNKKEFINETKDKSQTVVFNDKKEFINESKNKLKTEVSDDKKDATAATKNNSVPTVPVDKKNLAALPKESFKPALFNDKKESTPESKNSPKTISPVEIKNLIDERKDNFKAVVTDVKHRLTDEKGLLNLRQNNVERYAETGKNLIGKNWNDLIDAVKEHKNLEHLRREPKEFWEKVRQMSAVKIVETYSNGKNEPRAVSRYGELLHQMNRRGGQLENFVNTLPAGDRKIFLARFQINQVLGANELFVGRGIALDKRGEFPVRVFLAANGKNAELPAHSILTLLAGKTPLRAHFGADGTPTEQRSFFNSAQAGFSIPDEAFLLKNSPIFTNGQVLLNAKSAALLSLSLALYQNIDAALSLGDLVPETVFQTPNGTALPKIADKLNEQPTVRLILQNTFESGKTGNATRETGELLAGGALINGAFEAIDKYRKSGNPAVDLWADLDSAQNNFGFAAGATGAMMGATVGCVVPLAEKKVGEILGFAASVVVGLTDNGLQSLGANTLVSLVSGGVQNFLNASAGNQNESLQNSADKLLTAANSENAFEENFQTPLFKPRRPAFS